MITAYIDGSCSPANPGGVMGIGVAIYIDGVLTASYNDSFPSRKNNTSNKAEYLAVKKLLTVLGKHRGETILVYSDSQLVVTQMNGKAKINRGLYKPTALECKELLIELRKNNNITFKWIPREKNSKADELSKK